MLQPNEAMWSSSGTPLLGAAGAAGGHGGEGHAQPRPRPHRSRRSRSSRPGTRRSSLSARPHVPPLRAQRAVDDHQHHHRQQQHDHRQQDERRPGSNAISTYTPSTYGFDAAWYTSLDKTEMPLDSEVSDYAAGRRADRRGQGALRRAIDASAVPRHAQGRRRSGPRAMQWGNLGGPSTILDPRRSADHAIPSMLNETGDIRDLRFHEVTSPPLDAAAASSAAGGAFANGTNALYFYGTATQAQALAGRRLLPRRMPTAAASSWSAPMRRPTFSPSTPGAADVAAVLRPRAGAVHARRLRRGRAHRHGLRQPRRCLAGQGRARRGARQRRQPPELPDLPAAEVAAHLLPVQRRRRRRRRPELEIWVNGRLWTRVDALLRPRPEGSRSTSCARTPRAAASCSSATARPARGCPRA